MSKKFSVCVFILFFLSGFCGLLYQTVWLRLAFAGFGVITPVLSVVVSVFMLGLALGSWSGSKLANFALSRFKLSPLALYAIIEGIIGAGAFVVPRTFDLARDILLNLGQSNSSEYLLMSALFIAISLLPWCFCMGTTFPVMMDYINRVDSTDTRSFSRLYLANCLGAMTGTIITAMVLIELLGFRSVLMVGAITNFVIAATSLILSRENTLPEQRAVADEVIQTQASSTPSSKARLNRTAVVILFVTGFAAMAMEVVWTRAFLHVIGMEVYAFAELLFVYLLATCIGAYAYRKQAKRNTLRPSWTALVSLAVASLLPLVLNDPIFVAGASGLFGTIARTLAPGLIAEWIAESVPMWVALFSIVPCSYLFGFITPRIIDEYSNGESQTAGYYYAVNTVGCILGPLAASYILLPLVGSKYSLLMLSVPFLFFALPHLKEVAKTKLFVYGTGVTAFVVLGSIACTYEELPTRLSQRSEVRNDYAATVVAFGEGRNKNIMVNGTHLTSLNQCVKDMAHIPLAVLRTPPKSALVICFGMGSTFRSLMSWPIKVTAVELVPSVVKSFGYFHADAARILNDQKGQVIVDDGRRFLARTREKFDLITMDPSPVMEKGCASLIFSDEFTKLVKRRLADDGILQFFFGDDEEKVVKAVIRTFSNNFKYVRIFAEPGVGFFAFCSDSPLNIPNQASSILEKMPESARRDMLEWLPEGKDEESRLLANINKFLDRELPVEEFLDPDKSLQITDDKPINEYHLIRKTKARLDGTFRLMKPPYKYLVRSGRDESDRQPQPQQQQQQ